jgi:acyl dehydratase
VADFQYKRIREGKGETMALNLEVIGKKTGPSTFTYNTDTVILYALGIGSGVGELDFVYENKLKVFPTFAVMPIFPALGPFAKEVNLNWHAVLHGEHGIVLHRPIPTSGILQTWVECLSIYDKGDKGALLNVRFETRDEKGEMLFENHAVILDRSGGNFGGENGPVPERIEPPAGKRPDFQWEDVTSLDQSVLYRLSGDKNPLHIDPDFAKKVGLERPILHGLCTFGFAGRAMLHSVCGSDSSRLKSFSSRFLDVAYPGDVLITEGWKMEPGRYVIRTRNQHGTVVLGNAVAEVHI